MAEFNFSIHSFTVPFYRLCAHTSRVLNPIWLSEINDIVHNSVTLVDMIAHSRGMPDCLISLIKLPTITRDPQESADCLSGGIICYNMAKHC